MGTPFQIRFQIARFTCLSIMIGISALAGCASMPPSQVGQIQRLSPATTVPAQVMVQTDANQVQRESEISAQILKNQDAADREAAARLFELERQRAANDWAWSAYPAPYFGYPRLLAPAWGWGGHLNYGFGGRGHWRGGVGIGF
jgi:hypothetical protein